MCRAWDGDGLDTRGQAPLGLRLLVGGHAHSSLCTEARLSRAVLLNEADVILSHDDVTDKYQVTRLTLISVHKLNSLEAIYVTGNSVRETLKH